MNRNIVLARCVAERNSIKIGDLMYFTGKGQGGAGVRHATIISKIENDTIYYSAHTKDYEVENLSENNHLTK